ncbi:MAG: hypothetical protein HC884_05405 [Chloroflexaceae bacterium]|nr:hypothetical protein [Chloroflexaceae bacterium]
MADVADIVRWWLTVQVVGLAGLPITTCFFRALPDRGYALSKSLGLLLICYGAWMLAMLGLAPFGRPLLLVLLVLLGGGGVFLAWKTSDQKGTNGIRSLSPLPYLRTHWLDIVAYEVLFVVALLLLAWIRAHVPDPWGTERPMDYAFLNAIRISDSFPPPDPWLAGYSINYYYFGYLVMASVALLSGLEPPVAFNLSLALIFALTAIGVASILSNLVALTTGGERPSTTWLAFLRRSTPVRALLMLLGVVLVLLAGNQAGALQVIVGDERVVALDGPQLVSALSQSLQGKTSIDLPSPVRTSDFGTFETIERGDHVEDFNWWWPSRALWDEHPPPPPPKTKACGCTTSPNSPSLASGLAICTRT